MCLPSVRVPVCRDCPAREVSFPSSPPQNTPLPAREVAPRAVPAHTPSLLCSAFASRWLWVRADLLSLPSDASPVPQTLSFLHIAAHPLCLASPGPSAEACPTACPDQPLADILFLVQALCWQEPRRCRNMLFSAPPGSPVRASPVLPSPGAGCRACRGLSAAPVTAALCLAGPRGRRWRS